MATVTGYGTTTAGPITESTGTWAQVEVNNTATRASCAIFVKTATGSDAAPVFNCTFTGTASHARFAVMLIELYDSGGGTPAYDAVNLAGLAYSNSGATSLTPVTTGVVPVAGCFGVSGFVQGYSTSTAAKTFTRSAGWSALGADNTGTIYSHSGFDYTSTAPGSGSTDSNVMGWGAGTINGAAADIAIFTPPPVQSPGLELSGFSISGPGAADTINSVTVAVTEHQSNAAQNPAVFELWDYSGTPTQIGADQEGAASTSTGNVSSATFTGVTYTMLATLRVRVYGNASPGSGHIESVDGVSLVVNYTAAPGGYPTAATAVGTARNATISTASATSARAVAATGVGVAQFTPGTSISIDLISDAPITAVGTARNATIIVSRVYYPSAGVSLSEGAYTSGGKLILPCNSTYSVSLSGSILNLTGSSIDIRVDGVPPLSAGSTEAQFEVLYDASNYLMIWYGDGYAGLTSRICVAGTNTDHAFVTTYSGTTHKYWRVREASGTVYFGTSPNRSSWTEYSAAHGLSTKIQTMRWNMSAGYWGTETSPGPMTIGAVNTA